jgi:hypothetical protein
MWNFAKKTPEYDFSPNVFRENKFYTKENGLQKISQIIYTLFCTNF